MSIKCIPISKCNRQKSPIDPSVSGWILQKRQLRRKILKYLLHTKRLLQNPSKDPIRRDKGLAKKREPVFNTQRNMPTSVQWRPTMT